MSTLNARTIIVGRSYPGATAGPDVPDGDMTATIRSKPLDCFQQDIVGLTFAETTALARSITVVPAADHVDASDQEWVFANGAFTAAHVGAKLTIAGAANVGNNGIFTISAVTNATTIETTEAPGADETFGAGVTASLIQSEVAPTGTYTVYGSNTFDPLHDDLAADTKWSAYTMTVPPTNPAASLRGTLGFYDRFFPFRWFRVKYVPTTGGAQLLIVAMTKGI